MRELCPNDARHSAVLASDNRPVSYTACRRRPRAWRRKPKIGMGSQYHCAPTGTIPDGGGEPEESGSDDHGQNRKRQKAKGAPQRSKGAGAKQLGTIRELPQCYRGKEAAGVASAALELAGNEEDDAGKMA